MNNVVAIREMEGNMETAEITRRQAMEREELVTSLEAVADLMIPAEDLAHIDRDKLSTLIDYLTRKLAELTFAE